jgi:hypothetical protein
VAAVVSAVAESRQARTSSGGPNIEGIWQALNAAAWDIQDHAAELGVPAGQGIVVGNEIPYQPWALEQRKKNYLDRATADPESRCLLPGVPRATYLPFPFQIVQTDTHVAMLYEFDHAVRVIYTDGSDHPRDDVVQRWMGDARGRWEGDTLVVDVTNFTDQTWFDRAGNFHSDALHVVERYTRIGPDHLRYEATIDDPKVFTRPWKIEMPLYRRIEKGMQLLEYECGPFRDDRAAPTR